MFRGTKCGKVCRSPNTRRGASKHNCSLFSWNHFFSRFPTSQKPRQARHFPNFEEYSIGCVCNCEPNVCSDIKYDHLQRSNLLFYCIEKFNNFFLFSCVHSKSCNATPLLLNSL